jgi:hypothetical protein
MDVSPWAIVEAVARARRSRTLCPWFDPLYRITLLKGLFSEGHIQKKFIFRRKEIPPDGDQIERYSTRNATVPVFKMVSASCERHVTSVEHSSPYVTLRIPAIHATHSTSL